MKTSPSPVEGVILHAHGSPEFEEALPAIIGRAPRELLAPAFPFSVIVENRTSDTIAYLGIRFDMVSPKSQQLSVVHYADALRNPAKAEHRPGVKRFICAEPEYTSLVLRGDVAAHTRGRMNLDNLRRMLQVKASVDCVAFADGRFVGPDSQKAFERLAAERRSEEALIAELGSIASADALSGMLYKAVQHPDDRARRSAARKLLEAWEAGGRDAVLQRAESFHHRIPLWREPAGC